LWIKLWIKISQKGFNSWHPNFEIINYKLQMSNEKKRGVKNVKQSPKKPNPEADKSLAELFFIFGVNSNKLGILHFKIIIRLKFET